MQEPPEHRPPALGTSAHLQLDENADHARLRAELAPYTRDAEHLERLLGDAALVERLRETDFTGREWVYVETELARYGLRVLRGWMCTGHIWAELHRRGIGGLPAYPEWEWTPEAWETLASDTVVDAVPRFRDAELRSGRWNPKKRASVATFFIGKCLFCFPNAYRRWSREVEARQAEQLRTTGDEWTDEVSVRPGFEHDVLVADQLRRELPELDPRTRRVLALRALGYDQDEIAAHLGISRKTVETIIYRQTKRGRNRRDQAS